MNSGLNSLKKFEFKSSIYKKRIEEFKMAFKMSESDDERKKIIEEMKDLSENFSPRMKGENKQYKDNQPEDLQNTDQ